MDPGFHVFVYCLLRERGCQSEADCYAEQVDVPFLQDEEGGFNYHRNITRWLWANDFVSAATAYATTKSLNDELLQLVRANKAAAAGGDMRERFSGLLSQLQSLKLNQFDPGFRVFVYCLLRERGCQSGATFYAIQTGGRFFPDEDGGFNYHRNIIRWLWGNNFLSAASGYATKHNLQVEFPQLMQGGGGIGSGGC